MNKSIKLPNYIVIDFETANNERSSVCAIGLVGKINGKKVSYYSLVNPKVKSFTNTWVHGISKSDTKDQPNFKKIWEDIQEFISSAEFLVAHSAGFDKSALIAACEKNRIIPPNKEWICTATSAKRVLDDGGPYSLPALCDQFRIKLRHHNALSDAQASEKIFEILLKKCGSWSKFQNIAPFMKSRPIYQSVREFSSTLIEQDNSEIDKHWNELRKVEFDPIKKIENRNDVCMRWWIGDYFDFNIAQNKQAKLTAKTRDYCAEYLSAIKEWRSATQKSHRTFQESWIINEIYNLGDAQKRLRQQYKLLAKRNNFINSIEFFEKIPAKVSIPVEKSAHVIDIEMTNPGTSRFEIDAQRDFVCGSILDLTKNSCKTFVDGEEFVKEMQRCVVVYSYNGEGFDFYQLRKYGLEIEESPCPWIRDRASYKPKGMKSIDILDYIRKEIPQEHWWQNPHKLISLGVEPNSWPSIFFQKGLMGYRRKAAFKSIIDCALAAHIVREKALKFEYIRLRSEIQPNPMKIKTVLEMTRKNACTSDEEFCNWINSLQNPLIEMRIA